MKNTTVGFIGGGNMARSLIGGLIADGFDPDQIWVADPDPGQRETIRANYPIHSSDNNLDVIEAADVILLSVKPQLLKTVCEGLSEAVQRRKPLLISIAAGVREGDIDRWLGGSTALVRTMPNTPALVQSGATALHANAAVSSGQRDQAESIMRAVGLTLWVEDEAQMDAVTALSGSGPAYLFLVMEAMEAAGIELGLSQKNAQLLTLQTAFGAAKMALESSDDAATLRERVTSPGGTTEQALKSLEQAELRKAFKDALSAARHRATELAEQFGAE
ncbi:pyrroline-5-carboxylate reductase [Solemya pervernicosa gill symbiont]|uniref:Pyrroline-5-carboxylate reductase n=2 Tax=Gammaproteobacteria incertae sedis TaxID=118884 RepID=A0A1T2LA13_9GAMM|nr:pyrroline-5-carboxylate reductase [Candidatus Reidiella endopervernicosa]OOZ41935.1 pyrroline-5-carboxylate reductase [Solemya pervernicosa gill symbiont]QKQ24901.1 pyrroline-5-carboxylate reductase [Candidatus Reidiella endopervernicosa]